MMNLEKYLSDEAVAEFDRIVKEYERPLRKKRILRSTGGIAATAAAVTLLMIIRPEARQEKPISPVVIAEGITELMDINSGVVESVSAVPQGSKALVTLKLKNGDELYYIMSYDDITGSTSLVAVNDISK
ncbi:MAG: hypothetical protein IKI00_10080 [Bacteroidales bacterium]|nr:hypothetical protein [Bacteroidales bacterium]